LAKEYLGFWLKKMKWRGKTMKANGVLLQSETYRNKQKTEQALKPSKNKSDLN
jgi:uncharacterized protein YegP (UPF0339 family)